MRLKVLLRHGNLIVETELNERRIRILSGTQPDLSRRLARNIYTSIQGTTLIVFF